MTISIIEKQLREHIKSETNYDNMEIPIEPTENIETYYPKCNTNVCVFPKNKTNPKKLVLVLNLNGGYRTKINVFDSNYLNCLRELINNPLLDKITKYTDKINDIDTTKVYNKTSNSKIMKLK